MQDYEDQQLVEDVMMGLERTLEGICVSEGYTDQDDTLRTEMADKQTNTLRGDIRAASRSDGVSGSRSQGSSSGSSSEGRNSNIRRSQTFSPACRPGLNYICKVGLVLQVIYV